MFFVGGGGSPAVDGGDSPLDGSTAPTPLLSSLGGGDDGPTMLSPRTVQPGLDSRRRRRRRRRGEAFEAGDTVVVLATERFSESHSPAEFLRKKVVGRPPERTGWFHCFPLAIFALMLMWVLLGGVEMVSRRAASRTGLCLRVHTHVCIYLRRFAFSYVAASCACCGGLGCCAVSAAMIDNACHELYQRVCVSPLRTWAQQAAQPARELPRSTKGLRLFYLKLYNKICLLFLSRCVCPDSRGVCGVRRAYPRWLGGR